MGARRHRRRPHSSCHGRPRRVAGRHCQRARRFGSSCMKKALPAIVVVVVVAAVGLYFVLRGEEYELRLTQQEIQEKLDQKFPFSKRHLLLFEATYSNPK